MGTYARNPVEFVRGEGCRLWDADGNEYLDFLGGISVAQIGHAHPTVGRGGLAAGRAARARGQPLLHRARDAARREAVEAVARREGLLHELGRRGDRVRDQARAQAQDRGRGRRPRGRLPRPHLRCAVGDAAGDQAGAVRAARAGLRRRAARRPGGGRRRGRWRDRRRDHRADPGRVRHPPDLARRCCARRARHATATTPCSCSTRSSAGWDGPGAMWAWQHAQVEPDVMTVAKGLGGGLPIGACITSPDHADVLERRRSRLDVRGRAGDRRGRERGARRGGRRRAPGGGHGQGRDARRGAARHRARGRARPRPDAGRSRSRTRRTWRAGCCWSIASS